jgi:hypothetical protein
MDVVSVAAHKGEFFRVLQETERSQTAVMTIAPGLTPGPRRSTTAIRSCTCSRARRSCGSAIGSTRRGRGRSS